MFETVFVMKKLTVYCLIGLHLTFLLLTVFGGVLALWEIKVAYLHLPALMWAVAVELMHWDCPLTVWENRLRRRAAMPTYEKGFVEHYIFAPLLGQERKVNFELWVTFGVVGANSLAYIYIAFLCLGLG